MGFGFMIEFIERTQIVTARICLMRAIRYSLKLLITGLGTGYLSVCSNLLNLYDSLVLNA